MNTLYARACTNTGTVKLLLDAGGLADLADSKGVTPLRTTVQVRKCGRVFTMANICIYIYMYICIYIRIYTPIYIYMHNSLYTYRKHV